MVKYMSRYSKRRIIFLITDIELCWKRYPETIPFYVFSATNSRSNDSCSCIEFCQIIAIRYSVYLPDKHNQRRWIKNRFRSLCGVWIYIGHFSSYYYYYIIDFIRIHGIRVETADREFWCTPTVQPRRKKNIHIKTDWWPNPNTVY